MNACVHAHTRRYKQRGPGLDPSKWTHAAGALNVFYYHTYEGLVDVDAIADETARAAAQVTHGWVIIIVLIVLLLLLLWHRHMGISHW